MRNKIEDLRNHLFATLEELADKEKPMELDRARAIAEVAQVVINSAKVEVEFLKHQGGVAKSTGFLEPAPALPKGPVPRPALMSGEDKERRHA